MEIPTRETLVREARYLGLTGIQWLNDQLLFELIEETKSKKKGVGKELELKVRKPK